MPTKKTPCIPTIILQQLPENKRSPYNSFHLVCFVDSVLIPSSARILALFKQYIPHFALLDCDVFFVSRDQKAVLERWQELAAFPLSIIADTDQRSYQELSLIQPKTTFGKVYDVIQKHAFLYDGTWQLQHRYRRIIPDLPEKVLNDILSLRLT